MERQKKGQKTRKKKSYLPTSAPQTVLLIVTFIVEIALIALALTLDMLPGTYFGAMTALIIGVDALVFWLFSGDRTKNRRKIVGTCLCAIMILGCLAGSYYVADTYRTFAEISSQTEQTVQYDVVVLKDSAYESLDDIYGNTVYTIAGSGSALEQAKESLQLDATTAFEERTGCMGAGEKLYSLSGNRQDNILLISDAEYGMIDDIIDGFKDETKVIHKVKVKVVSAGGSVSDVTKMPYNILISGIDTRGEISDVARSDVNMILTVNPLTNTVLLTSMPRDSYVPLHMNGEMDKLTHSGVYGIDETIRTIEDWLSIDINYYVRVDFQMLVKLIDAVGGVDVYNDKDFYSSVKGWHYKKGWHHMEGRYALWFVRERKTFKDEDEQRIKNQQKVVKALLKKFTSKRTLLVNYTDILEAVGEDMQTNMSQQEMGALVKMQLKRMPKWEIKRQWVDGDDDFRGTWSMGYGRELFVSVPKEESVRKVSKAIDKVMYPYKED